MINQLKTVLLLSILTALLLLLGSFFGSGGLTIAFILAITMNFGSYFFSHKLVLLMYRAKEISESDNSRLHKIVESIARSMGLPKPRIYVIPTDHLNAFATGPSPKKAVVAFTRGIIEKLSEKELRGVAAHELAHIKNRDMLIVTIAATFAAVISYIAFMARWAAIFSGAERNRDSGGVIELLVLSLIAPVAATIIQLAISRAREYYADAVGATAIGDSSGLASALEKLHENSKINPLSFGNVAMSSLFIVQPFRGTGLLNLFSTHPPVSERIKRLRSLKV